ATIDRTTGLFTWTPTAAQAIVNYQVEVQVRDLLASTFTDVTRFTIQVSDTDGAVHYVRALYRDVLEREGEASGINNWVAELRGGVSRQQVTEGFWNSVEHRGLQVDAFYATYLHRAADDVGRANWINALLGGQSEIEVALNFVTSEEYRQAHPTTTSYL